MLIGTIDIYHFMSLSVTFILAWVTGTVENKTCWLHFLTHFSTDQDEICGVEAIEVERPVYTFEWVLLNQGK